LNLITVHSSRNKGKKEERPEAGRIGSWEAQKIYLTRLTGFSGLDF
jgi:hypothetical protein